MTHEWFHVSAYNGLAHVTRYRQRVWVVITAARTVIRYQCGFKFKRVCLQQFHDRFKSIPDKVLPMVTCHGRDCHIPSGDTVSWSLLCMAYVTEMQVLVFICRRFPVSVFHLRHHRGNSYVLSGGVARSVHVWRRYWSVEDLPDVSRSVAVSVAIRWRIHTWVSFGIVMSRHRYMHIANTF